MDIGSSPGWLQGQPCVMKIYVPVHPVLRSLVILGVSFARFPYCLPHTKQRTNTLKTFYTSKTMGFWTPIYENAGRDPSFDKTGISVAIVSISDWLIWQTSLVLHHIYMVIQHWKRNWDLVWQLRR
jgi:hypothetical protein